MGGYGSGRTTGIPTVESALRLDIDWLKRAGVIVLGARAVSEPFRPHAAGRAPLLKKLPPH